MAAITLLTPAEIAARDQKPKGRSGRKRSPERTRIIADYKALLRNAQPGDGADVLLEPGDDKRVVRQNLKAAALELHLDVAFRPVHDAIRIHLRFLTPEERAARPKRAGRPRKNVQPPLPVPPEPASPAATAVPKPRKRTPRSRAT